ncbi:MAG: efflux RND transporter permease subunit [Deltaproteobacteria bacterium]|nr:efflux RND transporter permease subunit [Deltaproteobacteria bacterium]
MRTLLAGYGRAGFSPEEALIQAGKNRMRPIARTTAAAILALMPLFQTLRYRCSWS